MRNTAAGDLTEEVVDPGSLHRTVDAITEDRYYE